MAASGRLWIIIDEISVSGNNCFTTTLSAIDIFYLNREITVICRIYLLIRNERVTSTSLVICLRFSPFSGHFVMVNDQLLLEMIFLMLLRRDGWGACYFHSRSSSMAKCAFGNCRCDKLSPFTVPAPSVRPLFSLHFFILFFIGINRL